MECLHLARTLRHYRLPLCDGNAVDTPPKNVQRGYLEECRSVKVKRLFLFMAEKARHAWFEALDLDRIDLGSGKRVIPKVVLR